MQKCWREEIAQKDTKNMVVTHNATPKAAANLLVIIWLPLIGCRLRLRIPFFPISSSPFRGPIHRPISLISRQQQLALLGHDQQPLPLLLLMSPATADMTSSRPAAAASIHSPQSLLLLLFPVLCPPPPSSIHCLPFPSPVSRPACPVSSVEMAAAGGGMNDVFSVCQSALPSSPSISSLSLPMTSSIPSLHPMHTISLLLLFPVSATISFLPFLLGENEVFCIRQPVISRLFPFPERIRLLHSHFLASQQPFCRSKIPQIGAIQTTQTQKGSDAHKSWPILPIL